MSYELELISLAVLLLLYDSTVLLYADEVIFICGRRQRWRASAGWRGFVVGGRHVCLLNPFTAHQPSVRLRWGVVSSCDDSASEMHWSSDAAKLTTAAPLTVIAGLALFGLLPLGLFTPLGVYAVLPAVALVYLPIVAALIVVHRVGSLPVFRGWKFAGLILECLACPPFGVNLIRRASLTGSVKEPLVGAAQRLLHPEQLRDLGTHCIAVLDEELAWLEDSSPRRQAVLEQRAHFEPWIRAT